MEQDIRVSVIANSLLVFPKSESSTVFQVDLVILNRSPQDIIPVKAEMIVRSPFNWFSRSLQTFKILCNDTFCILRESTLRETFYFTLQNEISSSEQESFCAIVNETREQSESLKFLLIHFYLSDQTILSSPVHVLVAPPGHLE